MLGGGDRVALTREQAAELDAADALRDFRERFVINDPERLYLDGNSLGRLPVATRERLHAVVEEWGDRLVSGWPDWIDAPVRAGDRLAEGVLGARPGEVLVCDSTTVNLYKLCSAALELGDGALVTDRGNFPTDRYVLEGLARRHGTELRIVDDLDAALVGAAVVVRSHVDYRSGELADVAAFTASARRHGARVLWDLSHSAGAVPVELTESGVELAVGCTYKYLNGGPGAPAFLFVAGELQPRLRTPIQGWFGQRDQFDMDRDYDPVEGIGRFMAGTPGILELAAVEEGVRLTAEAGIGRLREKSLGLCELIVALHDAWLVPLGFSLGSPREPERRGSHVSLRHPDGWQICQALLQAKVVPDFREPDFIRLGVAPLYTRYVDVWDALDRLRSLVEAGEHRAFEAARARVT